jgi:glycosyltransferase involved in cell wall biosynthesis
VTSEPTVSIIVPHYNDLARLDTCLVALGRQTYPRSALEVVVADNGSPAGEAAVRRVIDGRATLVTVSERGAGPARNGAVAQSTGDVLAFIDADCVADPDWVACGVEALVRADVVGGNVRVLVRDENSMSGPEAFERVFAFNFKDYIEKKKFTGAGNMFCRRETFAVVAGFGTGISEDVEWSRRAQSRGFSLVYEPNAVVGHPARETWGELVAKWRRINRETFALTCRQPGGWWLWLARTLATPLSILVHLPVIWTSPKLSSPNQRIGASITLVQIRLWRFVDGLALLLQPPGTP